MARAISILLVILFAGYWWLGGRPIDRPPGVLAPDEPLQQNLTEGPAFELPGHHLKALARFSLDARVLGAERYRYDRAAKISPVDLALGWGPMSSNAVLDGIDFDQYGRFYFWETEEPMIDLSEITRHSANMHMIPADDAVRDVLLDARPGNLIELEGYLVEVKGDDGFRWRSSMVRGDSGGGACEVIYVEQAALR